MIGIQIAHAAESPQVSLNHNAFDAILAASPVVQLTLLILIFLSILSWSIFFQKRKQVNSQLEGNKAFLKFFWKAKSLEDVYREMPTYSDSSVAKLFKNGYEELQSLAELSDEHSEAPSKLSGIDNIERVLRTTADQEISKLEKNLTWLATTGSTGPFIGLFGTVWGIMSAFQKIGLTGAASLAVVAPGISEALIATAIGLAAAIPAVIVYNHFINQIKKIELDLNSYASDFTNVMKRNWFKN
ncbi:MAG: protein TolQ [Bdellovibrionota bacterium]|nr:protein TolQ [Bdellovibrionota bacterium]